MMQANLALAALPLTIAHLLQMLRRVNSNTTGKAPHFTAASTATSIDELLAGYRCLPGNLFVRAKQNISHHAAILEYPSGTRKRNAAVSDQRRWSAKA